jgi:hypothetical protein
MHQRVMSAWFAGWTATTSTRVAGWGRGAARMEREIIRVEPIDSNFEEWGAVSTLQY